MGYFNSSNIVYNKLQVSSRSVDSVFNHDDSECLATSCEVVGYVALADCKIDKGTWRKIENFNISAPPADQ